MSYVLKIAERTDNKNNGAKFFLTFGTELFSMISRLSEATLTVGSGSKYDIDLTDVDVENHDQRGLIAEGVHVGAGDIGNQLQVGFVNLLEAADGGTIK